METPDLQSEIISETETQTNAVGLGSKAATTGLFVLAGLGLWEISKKGYKIVRGRRTSEELKPAPSTSSSDA